MKITMKKLSGKQDSLVLLSEHPDDLVRQEKKGAHPKLVCKISPGQTIDTASSFGVNLSQDQADQLGYHVLSKYPGVLVQGTSAAVEDTKAKKSYSDKSLPVQL